MALGGGTFYTMNKVLPGSYINYVGNTASISISDRGTVLLPLELPFGAVHEAIAVESDTDVRELFGLSALSDELLLLREASKRANTVLVWRLNSGEIAQKSDTAGLSVAARYPGSVGNKLTVKVVGPDEDTGLMKVQTYLDGRMVDEQEAETIQELTDNPWVLFYGEGELAANAGIALQGGTDGEVVNEDWEDFFLDAARLTFNTVAIPTGSNEIKQLAFSFVKRMREDEGVKIQAVVSNMAADYIGIISVCGGVTLEDGTQLSAAQTTAWVAGATAAAQVNQSLTEAIYEGAVGVDRQLAKSEYIALLKAGQFVLYYDPSEKKVKVLQDINTLTTFTVSEPEDWTSNRLVRTMDGLALESASLFGKRYLGKVDNDDIGRNLLHGDLLSLLLIYQGLHAVENVKEEDIVVTKGTGKRDVVVTMAVQGVDAMEKLYMTIYMN